GGHLEVGNGILSVKIARIHFEIDCFLLGHEGPPFVRVVSIHKRLFCPISVLLEKFNPRNINYMPPVKFFARLDLDQNPSFLDGH
ncbi:MAG: hypothetical protein WBY88_18395, partial [Desulfosarcina sp.]